MPVLALAFGLVCVAVVAPSVFVTSTRVFFIRFLVLQV
jgi:hypothetical protein